MNYFLSKNNYIFFIFAKRIEKKPYYNKRKHQMFYVIIQVLLTIQQIINTKTYLSHKTHSISHKYCLKYIKE